MKKTSSIKKIINDAKKGKMFILVDNKDRENEGDLVIPASKINLESCILMAEMIQNDLEMILNKFGNLQKNSIFEPRSLNFSSV